MNDRDEVWYVAYGSNLAWSRFRCYLEGGLAPGATGTPQPPARDPRPPADDTVVELHHRLWFRGRSVRWEGGGVAFLDPTPHTAPPGRPTVGRAWRIGADQFADVARGESGADRVVEVDLERLTAAGRVEVHPGRRYGTALLLGHHDDGRPLVTVTCATLDLAGPANPPGAAYRAIIDTGLAEMGRPPLEL